MALPPGTVDGKPWYSDVTDRGPERKRRFASRYTGGLVFTGIGLLVIWAIFGAPLFFESPHAVNLPCRGSCYLPASQYGQAELLVTAAYGGGGSFLLGMAALVEWYVRRESSRASAKETIPPAGNSEWSECSQCGGPLVTSAERQSGTCDGCKVLPS